MRHPSAPPMPIVVGAPRSGTTLLRMMLDANSALAIPPETGFMLAVKDWPDGGDALRESFLSAVTRFPPDAPAWDDFGIPVAEFGARLFELTPFHVADGFRLFYRMYAARFGKPRWGDKTPIYARHLELVERILPEAHFVHVIRDGRDVAVSLRRQWFSPGDDMRIQARYWSDFVTDGRAQGRRCRRYTEVRYEALVEDPELVLRGLCDVLELEFEPSMLRYYERAPSRLAEHRERGRADGSVLVTREQRLMQQVATTQPPDPARAGAWRTALTAVEIADFEEVAAAALIECGYPVTGSR